MDILLKRVLVLEDNPSDVFLIKKTLESCLPCWELKSCDNQASFEELLNTYNPDIILADIDLPKYDGFQALEYAQSVHPEIPFLFVTGSIGTQHAIDLIKKGALDVVFKNNLSRLEDSIYRALQISKSKELLRQTASMNRMLSEVSSIGAWDYNLETKVLNWTSEIFVIHERDALETPEVDKALAYYNEGANRDLITQAFTEATQKGKPYNLELLITTEKGNQKWVRAIGRPEMHNGACIRVYGTIQDITEKKLREANEKRLADRHQLVLEVTEAGTWDLDILTEEAIVDELAVKIFGYDLKDVASLNSQGEYAFHFQEFKKWIVPEDRAIVEEAIENHIQGKTHRFEVRHRAYKKDGSLIWVYSKGRITERGANGQPLRMIGSAIDVTKIREATQNFETLFMQSPLAKLVLDPKQFKIILANDKAADVYGYSIEELKNMSSNELMEHMGGIQLEQLRTDWDKGKAEKEKVIVEHINRNGNTLSLEVSNSVIKYEGADVVLVVLNDVTEKLKAEKEIKQLSLVASKSTNGVVITDEHQNIQWVNAAFEKMTGYRAQEIIGKNPRMLQGAATSDESRRVLRNAIQKRESSQVDIVNYHKKGTPYWLEIFLDPVIDEQGVLTNFIAIENDITERKKSEAELKQSKQITEKALHELRHQKFALDQHAIVAITNTKGTIEYVNDKFCQISQYSEEELIGQDHRIVNSDHHPTSFFVEMYKTLANGEVWHGEIKNKAKDGTYYWVDTTISPFIDSQTNRPVKYIAMRTDITQRKAVEEKLSLTLESLEDLIHERTRDLEDTRKELQESHNDLLDSVKYAKRIQQTIIPSTSEVQQGFADAAVLYIPKDIVSGDFYWKHQVGNVFLVAMVDCTGHGVPGAMMSMLGNELLDRVIIEKGITDPRQILEELDLEMEKVLNRTDARFKISDGMDMSICYINYETQTFIYAGAQSHGIYYKAKTNEFIPLTPTRRGIGGGFGDAKRAFSSIELTFDKDDRFYLFSDGYYDQWGGDFGKKLLRKKFTNRIKETIQLPLSVQRKLLKSEFVEWKGNEMQADDVTVLAVQL